MCDYYENVPSVCSLYNMAWAHGINVTFWTTVPPEDTFLFWGRQSGFGFWSPPRTVSTLLSWWMNPETLLWAINWVKPQGGSKTLKSHYQRQRLTSKELTFCNTGTLHPFLISTPFYLHLATFSEICIQVVADIVLSCIHLQPVFLLKCSPLPFAHWLLTIQISHIWSCPWKLCLTRLWPNMICPRATYTFSPFSSCRIGLVTIKDILVPFPTSH